MLSGFQVQGFAEEANNVSDLLDIMHAIGVMQDYEATTFKSEQKVTRAVFANEAAALIKEDDTKGGNVYYHDVSRDYWAFDSISRLTELGFINGNEEQCFNPEKVITRAEAAKVMLTILGYNDDMMTGDAYPQGYLKFARDARLFDGCSHGDEITMGDMLNIFKNSLDAYTVSVQLKAGGSTYKKSDVTMLERYYDMYFDKGKMTGCEGVNLSTGERIDGESVFIDGVEYETELKGLIEYLGCSVEFLYHEDDFNDRRLVWVKSTGKNDVLKLGISVHKEFNPDEYVLTYEYNESGNTKRVQLEKGINVIYNGAYVKDGIEDIFSKDRYSVSLIKNDGKYNLAIVEAYENYVAASIDQSNSIIYDKVISSRNISLDENDWDSLEIIRSGAEISFSDIKNGDVVSIFRSYDGNSVKAVVSSDVVDGNVESTGSDDEMPYIVIGGNEYEFYDIAAVKNVKPGDAVKLYVDFNGYIAEAVIDIGGETIAYVIRALYDDDTSEWKLRLLTRAGIELYTCHSKLRVDGVTANDTVMQNEFISAEGNTVQRLVAVKFDSEQKIRQVFTPNGNNSELKLYLSSANGRYRDSNGKLGRKVLIDNDTLIFSVPSIYSDNLEDFAVKSKSNLVNDQNYTADVYRYRTDDLDFEDILVMNDVKYSQLNDWDASILVDKINTVYDEEAEEVVERLIGYQGNAEVELYTDGEYSFKKNKIKSGDLIRVERDEKGKVGDASVAYSYQGETRPITSDYNAAYRIATVYANDKNGNALKVGYDSGASFDEIFNLDGAPILVYDPNEGEKIRVGTMGDIKTYKSSRDNCSTVVVQTNYMNLRMVVVYVE